MQFEHNWSFLKKFFGNRKIFWQSKNFFTSFVCQWFCVGDASQKLPKVAFEWRTNEFIFIKRPSRPFKLWQRFWKTLTFWFCLTLADNYFDVVIKKVHQGENVTEQSTLYLVGRSLVQHKMPSKRIHNLLILVSLKIKFRSSEE